MASGNTHPLDALFIRAAHKAAVYILELAMGTTMENSQPYAMLHGHPQRRQLMMSWRVQIVVKAWKLCPQKHAKLEQMPGASLTTRNRISTIACATDLCVDGRPRRLIGDDCCACPHHPCSTIVCATYLCVDGRPRRLIGDDCCACPTWMLCS